MLGYGVFVSSEVSIQSFVSGFSDFQKIKVQYSQRLPNRKLARRSRAHDGKSFQDCETSPQKSLIVYEHRQLLAWLLILNPDFCMLQNLQLEDTITRE